MLFDCIHPITREDILTFRRFIEPNSCYFSDSEAFVNSYVNGLTPAFCYNDGETIFFFNKLSQEIYFFCCPKGEGWVERMFEIIFREKERRNQCLKKVWLWELPSLIPDVYFRDRGFKSIKSIVLKRYILHLSDYKNPKQFLYKKPGVKNLRGQWNRFFRFLHKNNGRGSISYKSLSEDTYRDAMVILKRWKSYRKTGFDDSNNQLITREHVFNKDKRIIEDVLEKPSLYESLILYCNGSPRGVIVNFKIERSQNLSVGVFCTDREIPGTSEVLSLLFFEILAKKGYRFLNWGNSYSPSIDKFKKKFPLAKYEYSYEYFIDF